MAKPTVILRRCPTYDTPAIQRMALDALDALELRPYGRTLVKPNCVMSGDEFPHAYTRPEFLEGILRALKERARPDLKELALGERCGITIPTQFAFEGAGYYPMLKRVGGVKHYHFDEVPQVEVPLYHEGRLRDSLFTPEPVAQADFFVNCPKFKAHPWTTVTFSMKNYIGIQDDRYRLVDHDHKLNEKVRDLQYIIQPQFIAIDAITAGEGRMLTPIPFDLGMVIFGNNQLAFDVVCCHIIGIDPMSVDHIRMAYESGFGPADLSEIDIQGDLELLLFLEEVLLHPQPLDHGVVLGALEGHASGHGDAAAFADGELRHGAVVPVPEREQHALGELRTGEGVLEQRPRRHQVRFHQRAAVGSQVELLQAFADDAADALRIIGVTVPDDDLGTSGGTHALRVARPFSP